MAFWEKRWPQKVILNLTDLYLHLLCLCHIRNFFPWLELCEQSRWKQNASRIPEPSVRNSWRHSCNVLNEHILWVFAVPDRGAHHPLILKKTVTWKQKLDWFAICNVIVRKYVMQPFHHKSNFPISESIFFCIILQFLVIFF